MTQLAENTTGLRSQGCLSIRYVTEKYDTAKPRTDRELLAEYAWTARKLA